MRLVIGLLYAAASIGLVDGPLHGICHHIRVHDHVAVYVSGRAAHRLDQRGLRTQEAFFIGVQDRHQRDLRNIQALAQQIDAHQHIEHIHAHVPDDLNALQRIDI